MSRKTNRPGRDDHVGKSTAERTQYVRTQVRGEGINSTSTVGAAMPLGLGTDSPIDADEFTDVESTRRRRNSVREPGWLEKHGADVGKGLVVLLISAPFIWLFSMTITLNREVGALEKISAETSKNVDDVRGRHNRLEDKFDKFRDGVDNLREQIADVFRNRPTPQKK